MSGIAHRPREMICLDLAKKALAEAHDIHEIKDIRDKAEAVRAYCKQAGESMAVQNSATEVRLLAERRAGELLAKIEPKRGRPEKGNTALPFQRLEDLGVTKIQSSRWQQVASISQEDFDRHIEKTKEAGRELTTKAVLKLARRQPKPVTNDESPTLSVALAANSNNNTLQVDSLDNLAGMKFACLYADPPWQYDNQATRASTDNHYDTMTVAELCEMPVASLVADNAHLHLWTTNAFLFDAKLVMEAWGFEFRSSFIWVKTKIGIGNYWRNSHEFLLLGIRGDAKRFNDHSLKSWGLFDRTEHSSKPEEVRLMVEKASAGPYLELFGRKPIEGWTVFGNQIEQRLFAG